MKMKVSRARTLLLILLLGLAATWSIESFSTSSREIKIEIPEVEIKVPEVESEPPIIIRLCPDLETGKYFLDNGNVYFSREKAIDCTPGGGGGSS
jgi:hypothetical protein